MQKKVWRAKKFNMPEGFEKDTEFPLHKLPRELIRDEILTNLTVWDIEALAKLNLKEAKTELNKIKMNLIQEIKTAANDYKPTFYQEFVNKPTFYQEFVSKERYNLPIYSDAEADKALMEMKLMELYKVHTNAEQLSMFF